MNAKEIKDEVAQVLSKYRAYIASHWDEDAEATEQWFVTKILDLETEREELRSLARKLNTRAKILLPSFEDLNGLSLKEKELLKNIMEWP